MHHEPYAIRVTPYRAQWAHKVAERAREMDNLAVEIAAARILDGFALSEVIPIEVIECAERFLTDNNLEEAITLPYRNMSGARPKTAARYGDCQLRDMVIVSDDDAGQRLRVGL